MSEIEKQEAKGRKRNVQINIRISEAEAEQLRKKVEQSGMSQQEYILSCVLNKPITNTDGIKELVPELKRVGNNLNQIAHAAAVRFRSSPTSPMKSKAGFTAILPMTIPELPSLR